MKRTELRLPDSIYGVIRERAHDARISQNALITLLLAFALLQPLTVQDFQVAAEKFE